MTGRTLSSFILTLFKKKNSVDIELYSHADSGCLENILKTYTNGANKHHVWSGHTNAECLQPILGSENEVRAEDF